MHHCWLGGFTATDVGSIDASNSYENIVENNILVNCTTGIFLTGTVTQYGNIVRSNQVTGAANGILMEWPVRTVVSGNRIDASI